MSVYVLADRYLNAFVNCYDADKQQDALQHLSNVLDSLLADSKAMGMMASPAVSFLDKSQFLKASVIVSDPMLKNFLCLIIQKKRLPLFQAISDQVYSKRLELMGTCEATVSSSTPLDEPKRETLIQHLAQYFNKKITLKEVVDETLLGGVRVESQNVIFDMTLDNSLQQLKHSFQ